MMMKTRHMDCYTWRDHRIPLTFYFGEVSEQASYAHPLRRRFAVLASLEGPLRSFASSVLRFAYAHRLAAPSGDCFRNRVPSGSFAFCGASRGLGCPPRTPLTPGCPVESRPLWVLRPVSVFQSTVDSFLSFRLRIEIMPSPVRRGGVRNERILRRGARGRPVPPESP